jgi:uncharacterized membrane protein YagU involved in acid resistance
MNIVVGFIAAVLAVVLVHQPIVWAFIKAGLITAQGSAPPPTVYNMAPFGGAPTAIAEAFKNFGFKGFPVIFNLMFWGGMWGVGYGLVNSKIPGPALIKGLLFGLFMLVVGNWIVIPLIKGTPLFAGMVPVRMAVGATINISFCVGLALIYRAMRRNA